MDPDFILRLLASWADILALRVGEDPEACAEWLECWAVACEAGGTTIFTLSQPEEEGMYVPAIDASTWDEEEIRA